MLNIPYISTPDKPLTSTTWQQIPISDIIDDMVLLRNGGAAIVMESSSLNFGLLSEKEQVAVIAAYAALLNSLSFAIQIVVRSQRKDISNYMKFLDQTLIKITNPRLIKLADGYKNFIIESIKKKNVLEKRFYVIVPFSPLELGVAKSFLTTTKGANKLPFAKSYALKKAKIILYPKRDHLIRQAGRVGVKFRQLNQNELIALYYNLYNSEPPSLGKSENL